MATRTRERTQYQGTVKGTCKETTKVEIAFYSAPNTWYLSSGPTTKEVNHGCAGEDLYKSYKYSKITDDTTSVRDRKAFKPVDHYTVSHTSNTTKKNTPWLGQKIITTNNPMQRTTFAVDDWSDEGLAREYARIEQTSAYCNHLKFDDLDSTLASVFQLMRPQSGDVTGDLGFLVFLAELRDFKKLLASVKRPMESLQKLSHQLRPKSIGQLTSRMLDAGAEGRLMAKFCIEPFIADCQALYDGVIHIEKWLNKWNDDAHNNRLHVRHYDFTWMLSTSTSWRKQYHWEGVLASYSGIEFRGSRCVTNERKLKAIAHLWYQPERIHLTKVNKLLHQFDALGIGNIGSNIWNIIPFSFLVDYISSTDKFFSQFQKDCIEMPYRSTGMGYSITEQFISNASTTSSCGSGCATRTKKYFKRAVVPASVIRMPPPAIDWSLLHFELPSLGQLWNVAALIRLLSSSRS